MSVQALSTSASQILPQNPLRKSIVLQNVDASINIFIKFEDPTQTTVTSSNFDVRLNAGAVFTLNQQQDGLRQIVERVTAIAASGTPSIAVFETEDIRR